MKTKTILFVLVCLNAFAYADSREQTLTEYLMEVPLFHASTESNYPGEILPVPENFNLSGWIANQKHSEVIFDSEEVMALNRGHEIPVVEPNAIFSDGIFVFDGTWQFKGPVYFGEPETWTVIYMLSGYYEMLSKDCVFHVADNTQVYVYGTPEVNALFYPIYEVHSLAFSDDRRSEDFWEGFWVHEDSDNVVIDMQFASFYHCKYPVWTESHNTLIIRDSIFLEQKLGIFAVYPKLLYEENVSFINSQIRDDFVQIAKVIEHTGAPEDPNCHECDVNFDGMNDELDLQIIESWWMQSEPNATLFPAFCAIDEDDIVDQDEMDVLLHCWGKSPGPDLYYGDSKFIKKYTSSIGYWKYQKVELPGEIVVSYWGSPIATEVVGIPESYVPSRSDPNDLGNVMLYGNCWDRNQYATLAFDGVFGGTLKNSVWGRLIINWPAHISKSPGNPIAPTNVLEPEEYFWYDSSAIGDDGILLLQHDASMIDMMPESSINSPNYWAASVKRIYDPEWPDKGFLNPGYHFKGIVETQDRNTGHNPPGDFNNNGYIGDIEDTSMLMHAWLTDPIYLHNNLPHFEEPNDLAEYIASLPDPNVILDWDNTIVDLADFALYSFFYGTDYYFESAAKHIYISLPEISKGKTPIKWFFQGDHSKSIDCVHLYIDGDHKGIFNIKDSYEWDTAKTWNGNHVIKVIIVQNEEPYYSKAFIANAKNELSLLKIVSDGTKLFVSAKGSKGITYDVCLSQGSLHHESEFTSDFILRFDESSFEPEEEILLEIRRNGQLVLQNSFNLSEVRLQNIYNQP